MFVSNNEPCNESFAVTKSDTTTYAPAIEVLYVGTGGNLSLVLSGSDDVVVYKNLQSGQELYRKIAKVMAATTASDLVGSRRKSV